MLACISFLQSFGAWAVARGDAGSVAMRGGGDGDGAWRCGGSGGGGIKQTAPALERGGADAGYLA
jgi:hypothetical protein